MLRLALDQEIFHLTAFEDKRFYKMVEIGTLLDEFGVVGVFLAAIRFQIINEETTFLDSPDVYLADFSSFFRLVRRDGQGEAIFRVQDVFHHTAEFFASPKHLQILPYTI